MVADAQGSGLWARARGLVVAQLRQGATPHKLALTVAVASVIAVLPVLGATTLLCLLAGSALRLNHPLMQFVNYLLSGLQLLLILPFLKAGEWLGAPQLSLSLSELQQRIAADPLASLRDFGWTALGGVGAWALVAPFGLLLVYATLRPALERAARSRQKLGTATY